ncbi:MAG TPA: SDR family NAD(P)-dependent oxidoreductase, partial [Candidatus Dormibacteraeota bacterium]
MGRLDGKVALITGAGSGMGRLAAQVFVREGARVVAADLKAETVNETVAQLGGNAVAVAGDVTRDDDVRRMVETARSRFGRLDTLYNNAGIFDEADESVLTTTDAIWDRTMAVNVKGVAFCCKHGIPALID